MIPVKLISRLTGYFSRLKVQRLILDSVIDYYCRRYKVDTGEILVPQGGFRSFEDFFTRSIRPGIHKIDKNKNSIISPVDGRIDQFGKITACTMIQSKGFYYLLSELIPDDSMNRYFIDGYYITLYLSPADYHRIHFPVKGRVAGYSYYPGRKYSVRPYVANRINKVYCRNEKLITYFVTDCGLMAVCKIGAMNVGNIQLSYDNLHAGVFKRKCGFIYPEKNIPAVEKGSELGVFHMGSTVILVFQKDSIQFENLETGKNVRLGDKIARINLLNKE